MAQRDPPTDDKQRPNNPERPSAKPASASVPAADMQPEDAGTPASGADGRGNAAEPAMKQTSKTPSESNER